jgi:hypothetical protein
MEIEFSQSNGDARLTTICVLLSLTSSHGLFIHQMNVKTTFLNGEFEKEVNMD